ncbi:filamentous hemagglutinin N-terminal domain-containing protein [Leptothoe sp. LEGE 181152]|nr:filamentous hemagglutinin N-terminal domain-containing protein [Leptothoe sp. LEGE 181152]
MNRQWWFLGYFLSLGSLTFPGASTAQQVVPDTTLPINTIVDIPGCLPACTITGGTPQGTNLFHSFSEFSIPNGGAATFNEAAVIENIFSRVTGSLASDINGSISNNDANLLLINPNGIVFQQNASLNIQGSFLATTAEIINFTDDTQFSAIPTQTPSLLTVTTPIGLGFGAVPGDIINRSFVIDNVLLGTVPVGLRVPTGETVALLGGSVSLELGAITAEGGRVELGGVDGNSTVQISPLTQGFEFNYDNVADFQDINATASLINSSGISGGNIQIQGQNIALNQGTQVFNATLGGPPGSVVLTASESVALDGTAPSGPTAVVNLVFGPFSNEEASLTIDTQRLSITNGAQAATDTSGPGRGVDLKVNAIESVSLTGSGPFGQSGLFAQVNPGATGDGGVLTLITRTLSVQDGAQISTTTAGQGTAGDLFVQASDIELIGTIPGSNIPSGLFAQVSSGATGDGGKLTLTADQLTVLDGAQIATTARSDGQGGIATINVSDTIRLNGAAETASLNLGRSGIFVGADLGATQPGGDLNLTADTLIVENGANISADNIGTADTGANIELTIRELIVQSGGRIGAGSTLGTPPKGGQGPGGTLTVNASESVTVTGTGTVGTEPVQSTITTVAEGDGDGGTLQITTPRLNIENGGEVSARALSQGTAGNIILIIPNDLLVTNGDIRTDSAESAGGTITIDAGNILLSGDGDIRTNVASGAGSGGTIFIAADTLIALDDSDILAFAEDGAGGDITLPAFFGEDFEPAPPGTDPDTLDLNGDVDVNATGQLASGAITFPEISFIENSLTELPENLIDATALVANSCIAPVAQSSGRLTITGADSIPQHPSNASVANIPTGTVRALPRETAAVETDTGWKFGDPISEPQSLYQLPDGRIVLSRQCP